MMQIGSGNSTKIARKAINDQKLKTKITSIDPHPRIEIDLICITAYEPLSKNWILNCLKN